MSNKQARASRKLELQNIIVYFSDGSYAKLDISKVEIIDRQTKKPLFIVKEELKA